MSADSLQRFTDRERRWHWMNAGAVLLLIASGLVIWRDLDNWRLGGINVVVVTHVYAGGGLLALGALLYALGRAARAPHAGLRFNRGQRANLFLVLAGLSWMFVSGLTIFNGRLLHLAKPTRHLITQLHFCGALGIITLVLGHLAMVFLIPKHRGIWQAMWSGRIDRALARQVAPEWAAACEDERRAS